MSGGGKSGSKQKSSGTQTSESQEQQVKGSYVDPSQAPFLDWLRSQGMQTAQQQVGQIGGAATALGENLLGQGQRFLQSLTAPGAAMPSIRDVSLSAPALGEQAIQPVIDQLSTDIAQQLSRQIGGAGGVQTAFALGGGLGGGREGVERGLAQQGALDTFARQSGGLRLQDLQQRRELQAQLAMKQGELSLQGDIARQQGALGQQDLSQRGLMGGLQSLPTLANLGMMGYQAAFQPLLQYQQLLGAPTVLDYAAGWGKSKSTGTNTSSGSSKQGFFDAMGNFFG